MTFPHIVFTLSNITTPVVTVGIIMAWVQITKPFIDSHMNTVDPVHQATIRLYTVSCAIILIVLEALLPTAFVVAATNTLIAVLTAMGLYVVVRGPSPATPTITPELAKQAYDYLKSHNMLSSVEADPSSER